MNVVIVEDEPLTVLLLQETLKKLDCNIVGTFDNGADALRLAKDQLVDFVIMDIEIEGDSNGIQSATELRSQYNIPSVFITSHNDSPTINAAMQAQPIGYVIKPISVSHIESVVGVAKGLLGVTPASPHQPTSQHLPPEERTELGFGYSYNYDTRNLFHDDKPVDLTASELKLFDLCLRRQGNIIPYEVLDEQVWEGKIVTDSTRRGLFHRLRNKLDNHFIETVTGVGCRVQLPRK